MTNESHLHQSQFLEVIDRDEAERRFHAVLNLQPLAAEEVTLESALGRILARDITAPIDVPSFDRANVDGFAVRAQDTYGAEENKPQILTAHAETIVPGRVPMWPVAASTATGIATGAVMPRGADAVVMIEHTDVVGGRLVIRRPVAPGANITHAGTDIGRGETVLRRGELLTSRETGILAALGIARVSVVRRPQVAILSTGDELVAPGAPLPLGSIFDSNATVLADAVRELGGAPVSLGIAADERAALAEALGRALTCDVVLLSGGTSKGAGDLAYRVVGELGSPGIVAHGVALKPGKPLCLAAVRIPGDVERTVPIAVLPGFPTSAIFTFHEFLAPVIRRLGGRSSEPAEVVSAVLPQRVNSERGRTEYLLVGLVQHGDGNHEAPGYLAAYPMGKGSGSVTAFSRADGFICIPRQREYLEAGERVAVQLLGHGLRPVDLVVIGSHCVGLDYLLGKLQEQGLRSKFLAVGSTGGLTAARRGECDLAGIHLLDPATQVYNRSFVGANLRLLPGYARLQGVVYRQGDARFQGRSVADAVGQALADPDCVLVNRNRGSGTRVLIDQLLGEARPAGYWTEARSHNAVAAAVAQGRADWGVAIAPVAKGAGLGFLALQEEEYDFAVPVSRWDRPAVEAFRSLLQLDETRQALGELGFAVREKAATNS
jgi:putative molybdopterin biosynthesis protein